MKKAILSVICIISIFSTIFICLSTYSKYTAEAEASFEKEAGRWSVLINNTNITSSNSFVINNFVVDNNANVVSGKMAPGCTGHFDILINPSGTDVSVRYDLILNTENLINSEFQITSITEQGGNTLTLTAENTYTGVILLEDIQDNETNTVRISFEWENNELNNDADSQMANIRTLEVPVTLNTCQYLGETIVEYIP